MIMIVVPITLHDSIKPAGLVRGGVANLSESSSPGDLWGRAQRARSVGGWAPAKTDILYGQLCIINYMDQCILTHLPTSHLQPIMQLLIQEWERIIDFPRTVADLRHTPSSITTSGPITTFGPIRQYFPIFADGSWKLLLLNKCSWKPPIEGSSHNNHFLCFTTIKPDGLTP